MKRALICDLDMTLIDSRQDIAAAVVHAAGLHGTRPVRPEEVYPWIGKGLAALLKGLMPGSDDARVESMVEAYKERFFDHCADSSKLYPGVVETLETLRERGVLLAIATAKMRFMAKRVCEKFGIDLLFDHIQGTDDIPGKPDPAVVLAACGALGVPASEAVFVGDTPMDMRAAKDAGCFAAAVTYGIGTRDALAEEKPDLLIDSFHEIVGVFDRIHG